MSKQNKYIILKIMDEYNNTKSITPLLFSNKLEMSDISTMLTTSYLSKDLYEIVSSGTYSIEEAPGGRIGVACYKIDEDTNFTSLMDDTMMVAEELGLAAIDNPSYIKYKNDKRLKQTLKLSPAALYEDWVMDLSKQADSKTSASGSSEHIQKSILYGDEVSKSTMSSFYYSKLINAISSLSKDELIKIIGYSLFKELVVSVTNSIDLRSTSSHNPPSFYSSKGIEICVIDSATVMDDIIPRYARGNNAYAIVGPMDSRAMEQMACENRYPIFEEEISEPKFISYPEQLAKNKRYKRYSK